MNKLRKRAKQESKSVADVMRKLAESYAEGQWRVHDEPLADVVARIHAMRERNPKVRGRSEDIIRAMRDAR